MIKAVYDTNVLVSAMFSRGGTPAQIVELAFTNQVKLIASREILQEYYDVLLRPQFPYSKQEASLLLSRLVKAAKIVKAGSTVRAARDPDDNIFLECALAGKARYLVTGNKDDFPSRRFKYTRIVSPKEFLSIALS